jgi:hypothetical protein
MPHNYLCGRRKEEGRAFSGGGLGVLCLRWAARRNCSPYCLTIAAAGLSRMPTPPRSSQRRTRRQFAGRHPRVNIGTICCDLDTLKADWLMAIHLGDFIEARAVSGLPAYRKNSLILAEPHLRFHLLAGGYTSSAAVGAPGISRSQPRGPALSTRAES